MRAETLEAGCPDEETVAKYRTMSRGCLNLHRQLAGYRRYRRSQATVYCDFLRAN